ncbi:MAG: hypothetical protein DRQ47_04875, partial [Gammaproteobacteria bacterium]
MGGKSAPAAPDYTAAAQASADSSREVTEQQTWANRPDQNTPWGSSTWEAQETWDPTTEQWVNQWTQNTTVDPTLQWALDNQMYLQGARSELGGDLMERAYDEFGQPMDWSQFGDWGQAPQLTDQSALDIQGGIDTGGMQGMGTTMGGLPGQYDPSQEGLTEIEQRQYDEQQIQRGVEGGQDYSPEAVQRNLGAGAQYTPEQIQRGVDSSGAQQRGDPGDIRNRAEQAIYDRSTSRLDPRFEQAESDMESQLWNKGLRPGDAAYDREMENFGRQKEDAYQTAMTESIMGGGAEAERQFGMQMQGRDQDLNQLMQEAQFGNQAAQQALQQQLGIGQQEFQQMMSSGQFANQAGQQAFDQRMQGGGQQFQENLQQGQFANQASEQALAQQMGIGQQEFQQQQSTRAQEWMEQTGLGDSARANREQMMQQGQAQFQQQQAIRQQQFMEAADQRGMSNEEAQQEWQAQSQQDSQRFQQQLQQANYQNEIRMAQIAEEAQRRGYSLNEINALISGQQVSTPQFQGFTNAQASDPVDYMGAADLQYQGDMGQYGADQAGTQALMGGLGSAAGMFGFSDRRLKKNIRRIGTTPGGTPWYSFDYLWGEH